MTDDELNKIKNGCHCCASVFKIPKLLAHIVEQQEMITTLTEDLLATSDALNFVIETYGPEEKDFTRRNVVAYIKELRQHHLRYVSQSEIKSEDTHTQDS